MSERSKRQREFLANARKLVEMRMRPVLENPALDDEDISALFELEVAKEVASAMFVGGEYGVNTGTSLEDYIKSRRALEHELKKKDQEIAALRRRLTDGGPGRGHRN